MAWLSNPLAFTRGPVTSITTLVYLIIITAVIVTQTRVPPTPASPTPIRGINLTEAWDDLQLLSAQYHPFNSRRNDFVHDWLVQRIETILKRNDASATSAYVFEDNKSNLTFSSAGSTSAAAGVSVYFEGTNIITYIRGTQDDQSEWWTQDKGSPSDRNGVLVNAHYDSVSTGFGATDDGVGVISVLQLIRYYTTRGNTPKNGMVLLLNNGEEDFLNGASVFSQHPMAKLVSSFLNLEGAGAGGRAALFRSTDEEVTNAYAKSPYPFGTIISADAFKRGLVRSQTDYVVFNGKMGLRGLDVAFIAPRARYHTDQDDSRHTGRNSLWHMLSSAVATTKELTKSSPRLSSMTTTGNNKHRGGGTPSTDADASHDAVWFDLFGELLAVMRTHTFFALSITVLVVGPLLLLLTMTILYRADKFYLFSSSRKIHMIDGDESFSLQGWRGFFRFPLILILACAAPVALAYLVFKINPYIAHSSEWAVWSMMGSSFVLIAWFFCRSLDFARPSALTRAYGLSWLCSAWWVLLVAATVFEEQFHVRGGYLALFYSASLFAAAFIAYLELFSLPKKSKFCAGKLGEDCMDSRPQSLSRPATATQDEPDASDTNAEEDATERSSLLHNRGRSAYKKYSRSVEGDQQGTEESDDQAYNQEQEWSKPMWSWLWVLEFLILIPINIILLGQLGVFVVTALHQTGADGSSMFLVYISMAILTIFIFTPLVPLLHRFTWHVPMFLLLVLVGTLIYNMLAFPFSDQNRLKLFFQQEVDLSNGTNTVSLIGVPGFVQDAISSIPSAAGQKLNCTSADTFSNRLRCSWVGPAPRVANSNNKFAAEKTYASLVNYNISLISNSSKGTAARFVVYGKNTRACKLVFDSAISDFSVSGQGPVDKRFPIVPEEAGSKEIRLWSRTWDRAWTVDVTWSVDEEGEQPRGPLSGKVVCLWSDVNQHGVIPAFDEAQHFAPDWVAITKAADGLVEGFKRFRV